MVSNSDGPDGQPIPALPAARRSPTSSAAGTLRPEHLYKAVGLFFLLLLLYSYLEQISRVLLLVYASVVVAVALNELVRLIPFQRKVVSGLLGLAIFAAIGLLLWLGVPALAQQVRGLVAETPRFLQQMENVSSWVRENTGLNVRLIGDETRAFFSSLLGPTEVVGTARGVVEAIIFPIMVLIGALFAVANPNRRLLSPLLQAVPRQRRDDFRRLFELLGARLKGWVKGTLLSMLAVGILTTLGLWALGVRYALLLGVVSGLLEVIPFAGPWVAGAIAVSVTLVDDPSRVIWVILLMLAIQQIENNFITPLAMAQAAKVHPFVTVFGLFLFGAMFGFLGLLLALPLVLLVWTTVEVLWVDRAIQAESDRIEPVVQE